MATGRSVPIRRCPNRPGGRRSPPSTNSTSSAAYDAAPDGQKGAVVCREGLYSSHTVDLAKARFVVETARAL
jgi:hypothetical protein